MRFADAALFARANAFPPSIPALGFGDAAQKDVYKTKGAKPYGPEASCVVEAPSAKKRSSRSLFLPVEDLSHPSSVRHSLGRF